MSLGDSEIPILRPPFRDEVARLRAASAGRLGSAPVAFAARGDDASREDRNAPGARRASVECCRSIRQRDCRRAGVAPSTVRLTLKRLAAAGLCWPLPSEMTEAALEARLFAAAGKKQGHRRRAEPDWAAVHRELKRKHVTRADPVGRVHRAASGGLPLLAVLRAVPHVGVARSRSGIVALSRSAGRRRGRPFAAGELVKQGAIETVRGAVIDFLDDGLVGATGHSAAGRPGACRGDASSRDRPINDHRHRVAGVIDKQLIAAGHGSAAS